MKNYFLRLFLCAFTVFTTASCRLSLRMHKDADIYSNSMLHKSCQQCFIDESDAIKEHLCALAYRLDSLFCFYDNDAYMASYEYDRRHIHYYSRHLCNKWWLFIDHYLQLHL